MANSIQKVGALIQRLGTVTPRTATEAALLSFAPMALPALQQMLPQDPDELDALIDRASEFVRELKSDPEPADAAAGEDPAQVVA